MPKKPSITAHMIVKNDDQWVWFAIQSTINSVDRFIITDTGSQDNTVALIQSIQNPKIEFHQASAQSPAEIVALRKQQLAQTKSGWLWMIDADEIYPEKTCREIHELIVGQPDLVGVLVRRFDMLGDMHYYQPNEQVGGYHIFGTTAHYSPRLIRTSVRGLTLKGEYPNEGFYDGDGKALLDYDSSQFAITHNRYLHATYLKRSSLGATLASTIHRDKYKQEWGRKLPASELPEIFFFKLPQSVPNPLQKRTLSYEFGAAILTPIKMIKRKLV